MPIIGRPKIQIDWVQFEKLCAIFCTKEEIADWFNCSLDTIERACKRHYKETFAVVYKKKMAAGKISLRRKQYEVAMSGNVTMLVWTGKQYLGQKDKIDFAEDDGFEFTDKDKV
ncbi:MAG: hypothetical protein IPJ03_16570 [Ignavibacteriales bacterium]|nr:hypothetical protein [Ignavibacteriales bacterium]